MTERTIRKAPHMVQNASVRGMMMDVIVALLPAFAMSVFLFGRWVLVLCALSVGSSVLFEYLYRRFTRQSNSIGDLSACVTGLLLCMTLPSDSAWWVPVLGAAFAIVVVKQFYGGVGRNFMNPALAGRMLLASFPALMTSWVDPTLRLSIQQVDTVSAATPMSYLHFGNLPPQDFSQLLLGHHSGSLGESCAVMLLLGGLYLMGRRVISSRIPIAYLGTVALLTFLFPSGNCGRLEWMAAQLCSGGLMLGALFMATDPTTTPVTPRGHVMFGVGCGVLTVVLRYFAPYYEGVGWAILTMNCCAWLLDKVGLPRRFGDKPFAEIRGRVAAVVDSLSRIRIVRPDLSALATRDGEAPGESLIPVLREHGKNFLWLLGVVLCTGAMIFGVHRATDLAAVRADTQAQQEQLEQVMPGAAFSSESPYWANGALSILYAYDEDNAHMGYCVEIQSQGFGGMLTMMVGVDLDGKVTGVAVTDHKETMSVVEAVLSWQNLRKYEGLSGTIRYSGSNNVDVISGATATSRAITDGVNQALAIVAGLNDDQQLEFEESELE